jgi:hypothetical protein
MSSDNNQVFPTLSNVYAQMLMTPMTSKTHTYSSQAIVMSIFTYTLKSWQFPLICDNPLWLYVSCELLTLSMLPTFLSIPMHQGLDILVCPLCNPLFHVPYYFIYSILILDHYLRSFPSHCLAHCLSIARYIWFLLLMLASHRCVTYLFSL